MIACLWVLCGGKTAAFRAVLFLPPRRTAVKLRSPDLQASIFTTELSCLSSNGTNYFLAFHILLHVCGCFTSMYACVPCAYLVPVEVRRGCRILWNCSYRHGVGSSRTVVTDGCELLRDCWELDPGCLAEQPVFLATETSFQPPGTVFFIFQWFKYALEDHGMEMSLF